MDMFSVLFPSTAAQLDRIEQKVDELMATYAEAKQEWVDYTQQLQQVNEELTAQNDALRAALVDAQSTAQANAEALQAFQDDDAATDAQQLADQEQAFADDLQKTLTETKQQPAPPPVEPDPLPDQPHPDNTLPGDLPPE